MRNSQARHSNAQVFMCRLSATRISTLALDDNEIGKEGGFKLASVLQASSVTKLHLSGNYLGAEGAGK